MIDTVTPQDAWRTLEHIAAEFRPDIRPLNAKSLAYLCQDIARQYPGHLHDRIGTCLAASGLCTLFVGPRTYPARDPRLVEALGDMQ